MVRARKFSKKELYQTTKEILLDHGYDGFTFSKVAKRLDVSRGTIYKYFEKKEELITEYMVYEMEQFIIKLEKVDRIQLFQDQFHYLIDIIFEDSDIHQIRGIAFHIPTVTEGVRKNKEKLEKLHQHMYKYLQQFVKLGRKEKILKQNLPDSLIIGFIFQTIDIPNHFRVPEQEWAASIKEIISHGMFIEN